MKKVQLGLAMLLSVFIISCSDDDDNGKKDQGGVTDGAVVQPDMAVDDDTGTTEDDTGTTGDTTVAEGACMNAADGALLDTEAERDVVTAAAQTCGIGCVQDEDPGACSTTCVSTETDLSAECSACYGAIVLCSIENCVAECLADPASEACATCQATNCLPAFYTCSGMQPAQ